MGYQPLPKLNKCLEEQEHEIGGMGVCWQAKKLDLKREEIIQ